jgi:signal transduction histidine kinase
LREFKGGLFCIIDSPLPPPLEMLTFVYAKDESALTEFKAGMTSAFLLISSISSALLGGILLFLLVGLTRPFRKLSAAAAEISGGDYSKRVRITSHDEIADFANSFNLMADNIQKHVAELTRQNEIRQRFAGNLSHELRTPITAIAGYAELLKIGSISDAERARSLDYISEQSHRLKRMSSKLMELMQLDGNEHQNQPLSFAKITASAGLTCAKQIRDKEINFQTDFHVDGINGDAVLIESLLQNLIENAVKASNSGGIVSVGSSIRESGGCMLWVRDNGHGMAAEEVVKVVEPFYRVDKARTGQNGGAGLGLALCARICEIHGAKMEIISESGVATTVEITFGSQFLHNSQIFYNSITTS